MSANHERLDAVASIRQRHRVARQRDAEHATCRSAVTSRSLGLCSWHDAHATVLVIDSRVSWNSTRPSVAPAFVVRLSGGCVSHSGAMDSLDKRCR